MSGFQFHIEIFDDDVVRGWVVDPDAPGRPCRVQITVDDRPLCSLLAADLVDVRLMDGFRLDPAHPDHARLKERVTFACGFSYRVATSVPRGQPHRIEVSATSGGKSATLQRNKCNLAESTLETLRTFFADFRFIALERITVLDGARIAFDGWGSVPPGRSTLAAMTINGTAHPVAVRAVDAPPDPNHFTFQPERSTFVFEGEAELAALDSTGLGYRFTAVDEDGRRAFPPAQDYHLPAYWRECLDRWPLPPVEALGKVAPWIARRAEAEGDTFVRAGHFFAGFTDLQHVDQVVRAHTGRSLTEMEDVLDWGCGCGRVTQHLARAGVVRPAGADIDPENIAWCIDHIPDARFERLALDPPTPYPDDSFDAVFGLSVFTHLTEADQFRWLEELRRILKPGGVLAVTVAGHNALKRAALGAAIRFHRSTRERGFADDNIGNLFGDLLQDRRAYYRNTRHLPDYVRERWSPYFEILGIELGAMAGQQDVVIGRKRG